MWSDSFSPDFQIYWQNSEVLLYICVNKTSFSSFYYIKFYRVVYNQFNENLIKTCFEIIMVTIIVQLEI